jgi:hypothetical protein
MAALEAEQEAVVDAAERRRSAKKKAAVLPALELRLISLLAAQRELLEQLASEHASGRPRGRRREAA